MRQTPSGMETAPYFRSGQAATLDDVIEFYNRGGDPAGTLYLSGPEKRWLKEFLKTLTGDPVPHQYLVDTHNQ